MWNILNFEISRMHERHSKRNQTIFGDYWLYKIPSKGISTLYLLYGCTYYTINPSFRALDVSEFVCVCVCVCVFVC